VYDEVYDEVHDEVHDEVPRAAKPQPNRTKFFTEGNEGNKDFVALC
jgi:hypothetical protein